MKIYTWLIIIVGFALLLGISSCSQSGSKVLKPGEGFVNVEGGRIWYRVVGTGDKTPLLVIHGGPGMSSYYLKPLAALADERPVIFYDQLGSGHSDKPTDTNLWTVNRFVEEVSRIRRALGLTEVHLYGHSWGSIIATEYMLTKPTGITSAILAGPALSVPLWIHNADSLLHTLPDSLQQVIRQNEEAGTTNSPEYQGAMFAFYAQFVARKYPWSADIDSTFAQMNSAIYNYMQGPSEFTITGTLKNYDITKRLGEINVPTLFLVGEFDEAVPSSAQYFQSLVPGAELAIIPNTAHLAMQDDSANYVQVIRDFLHRVEPK